MRASSRAGFAVAVFVLAGAGCRGDERPGALVRVRVPEVVGWGEQDAINRVVKARLCVRDVTYVPQWQGARLVVEQWPRSGVIVREGLRMKLVVSVSGSGIGGGIWNVGEDSYGRCPLTHRALPGPK